MISRWWRKEVPGSVEALKKENEALWERNMRLRSQVCVAESKAKDRDDLRRIVSNQRLELYRLNQARKNDAIAHQRYVSQLLKKAQTDE